MIDSPPLALAPRRRLRYRSALRGAGSRLGRPMTHALPVLWRQYVTELRVNRKLAPKSIHTYGVGWGSLMPTARLMGWRLRTVEDITYERIIEWQAALMDEGKKPTTCAAYMNTVRGFTRWANIHGHAKTDPSARFKSPRLRRILPVLPPFEVMEAKLSAEPSLRNRVILSIGLYGGLRAEEISNLARSNFVPDAGLMGFVGKGSKQRSVALPERALAVIRQYVAATAGELHDPLIRKEDGSRAAVSYWVVWRIVKRWDQAPPRSPAHPAQASARVREALRRRRRRYSGDRGSSWARVAREHEDLHPSFFRADSSPQGAR